MDLESLGRDRYLRKTPSQNDGTKDAVFTAQNPAPRRGADQRRKVGRPDDSEEDAGAPNIITGTVIIACIIQTSALPSRIELQGNDLTFFDDTYSQNGQVIGDTSRLIFTHGSGKKGEVISQGYIIEKRASVFNTYDNVISWYALTPKSGAHNYMFIGRNASGDDEERNVSSIHFAVNSQSDFTPVPNNAPLDGVFEVEYSVDGAIRNRMLYMGKSTSLFPGSGIGGFSSLLFAGDGGLTGIGYTDGPSTLPVIALYMLDDLKVLWGLDFLPDQDNAYDIGSPSFRVRNIYVAGAVAGASIGLPGGITWTSGVGSPEGVVTAPIGSLYSNTSGGASTTLYVKTSGTGNTGWTAK